MPIQVFIDDKSFDPNTLDSLDKAFQGACADLGVSNNTFCLRELVAKTVIQMAEGQRDAAAIRAAVVRILKARD